jgi:anhydro-N-acetylmuramic acid kinase
VVSHVQHRFTRPLQRRILEACLHGTVAEICELNFMLGEHFACAALAAIHQSRRRPKDILAIASHGQTVHHLPNARTPATLQIGEPAVIAERTGITTVADFRVGDMAAGGQGAPLVPYADWALFTNPSRPRIIQNLGGIGNLTFLPPNARLADVLAFDTGPGNMVIDAMVRSLTHGRQTFDENGAWASRGQVSEALLTEMKAHPFLHRKPPKTTGREEFGETFTDKLLASARRMRLKEADLIATATAFTAASTADAYRRFVFPKLKPAERMKLQIILGGGGAKNPSLRRMLEERVPDAEWRTHEDFGIANAAKEALAFAILAFETLRGRPSNVPNATGANHPVILGKIVHPPN